MKKLLLVTLMLVVLLTLSSCKTNNEAISDESNLVSEENNLENEVAETVEIVEDELSETSEEETTEEASKKTTMGDTFYTNDSVVFELENTYYNENGSMIVEGYIVSVSENVECALKLKKLEIYNKDDELIASNCFGYIEENYGYVDPGEKLEVTLMFPSVTVLIKDDDLDSLSSVSKFASQHWK